MRTPCPHKRPECQNRRDAREDEAWLDGEVPNGNEDRAGDEKSCEKCDSVLSPHDERAREREPRVKEIQRRIEQTNCKVQVIISPLA